MDPFKNEDHIHRCGECDSRLEAITHNHIGTTTVYPCKVCVTASELKGYDKALSTLKKELTK